MRIDNSKIAVIIGFPAILRESFSTGYNGQCRFQNPRNVYITCFIFGVFRPGYRIWQGDFLGADVLCADCLQERFNLNYS